MNPLRRLYIQGVFIDKPESENYTESSPWFFLTPNILKMAKGTCPPLVCEMFNF